MSFGRRWFARSKSSVSRQHHIPGLGKKIVSSFLEVWVDRHTVILSHRWHTLPTSLISRTPFPARTQRFAILEFVRSPTPTPSSELLTGILHSKPLGSLGNAAHCNPWFETLVEFCVFGLSFGGIPSSFSSSKVHPKQQWKTKEKIILSMVHV